MHRKTLVGSTACLIFALTLAACSSTPPDVGAAATATTGIINATATTTTSGPVDRTKLPLGDNHVATQPQTGYVFACQTHFNGGGAFHDGPWIQGSTWNATTKIAVQGAVAWPQAAYSVTINGNQRVITTQDVPLHATTGVFPIAQSDPAFAYDRNPNTITPQTLTFTLPATPTAAAQPSCLPGGPIGVLTDGVALFDALDAGGRDAAAHEVLDSCEGHPERTGVYHHHTIPDCILKTATGTSTLVGYASDGFGIYVERDASGNLLTNADLDSCHGRTSPVTWNGQTVTMYHYVATYEYPYTLGCFMGTPTR